MSNEVKVSLPATDYGPGDLIDEHEAAAILGCAVQSMRNWRWRSEGPPWYKIGLRMVRYKRSELAAYIDSQRAA